MTDSSTDETVAREAGFWKWYRQHDLYLLGLAGTHPDQLARESYEAGEAACYQRARAEMLIQLGEWAYQHKRDPEARRTLEWVEASLRSQWAMAPEPRETSYDALRGPWD